MGGFFGAPDIPGLGLGDTGTPDFSGEAGNYLSSGYNSLTNKVGLQNPNSTAEGRALAAQKGDTVTWGGTAMDANRVFGTDVNAPQAAPIAWQQAGVQQMQAAQAAQGPQMQSASFGGSQLDAAQANQTRDAQNQLSSSLTSTAAGQGPSVAQEQLRQSTAANINQQMSAAQSMHGTARLAAMRNAGMQNAAIQQQANSQASGLRAQEIATAQSNLGNVLGTQRGQDIGLASQNAQLAQQTGMTNSGYQQQANSLNAQLGQQTNLANAGFQQGSNMTNAGAMNQSALAFAQQQNAGNLSLANMNLGAQTQTNALNTQRGQDLIMANQNAAAGQTGIAGTMYTGTGAYNASKAQMVGQGMNNMGQGMNQPLGGGGGGGAGAGGGMFGGGGGVGEAAPLVLAA